MDNSRKVVLALGSNLGDRKANIKSALKLLQEFCEILACSKIYETSPVGYLNQGDFLNAAILAKSSLPPLELLFACKAIEEKLGREKSFQNAPRIIDIDIIFYENFTCQSELLTIPHSRWKDRDFVKTPMLDLIQYFAENDNTFEEERKFLTGAIRAFKAYSEL